MYTIFKRSWWRIEKDRYGMKKRVPNPGARRTTLAHVETESEARQWCKEWNDSHEPGATSTKAEYTGG